MLTLNTLAPAESLPPEASGDNAFLWQAEAKPLPDLADPSDDDVQEIVIPGADGDGETRLVFDAHEKELAARVAGACNSIYVTSGTPGLEAFTKAILDPGYTESPPARVMVRIPKKPVKLRGEPVWKDFQRTPKRGAILRAVDARRKTLTEFAGRAAERVGVVAVAAATARLEQSARQTLAEALRYLKSGSAGPGPTSRQLVQKGAPVVQSEMEQLADALTRIATMRREVTHYQIAAGEDTDPALRGAGGSLLGPPIIAPQVQAAINDQRLRAIASPSLIAELGRAARQSETSRQLLAQECAVLCRTHPVLYRLWDQPIAFEVADVWNNTPQSQRLAALVSSTKLAPTVTEVLNDTSAAALAFIAELRANPDEVWRYDAAIYAGLRKAHLNQGDIAWRAVEEYLEKFKGSMSTLSKVSLALNGVEQLAVACAVAPPIAAALSIATAAASVAELVESAVIEAGKDQAFAACLNPGDSLALQAGSYGGVVLGAVFMLVQLRDTGKALSKAAGAR